MQPDIDNTNFVNVTSASQMKRGVATRKINESSNRYRTALLVVKCQIPSTLTVSITVGGDRYFEVSGRVFLLETAYLEENK